MMDIRKITNEIIKSKKLTKEQINNGVKIIKECGNIYYNTGEESPLLDKEYDDLFIKISKYKNITSLTEPTSKRLVSVDHEYSELVGTLAKTNSVYEKDKQDSEQNSVEEWLEKIYETVGNTKLKLLVTLKYDGNSVCLILKNGKVVSALTRGKDGKGADVSNLFKDLSFPVKGECGIKTEIMITDEDFDLINEETNSDYSKPRSVVAGILSKSDGYKFVKYITAVPLRIQTKKGLTRKEEIEIMSKFKRNKIKFPTYEIEGNKKKLLEQLKNIHDKILNDRHNLNFAIDGLVIEILNDDIRNKLGRDKDKNKYDVALKFPPLSGISKVKDIEFYASKSLTGRVTPVVVFDDLIFDGATCNHVSLSNYKRFKELNLAKGDEVVIDYRNDCLSYCSSVASRSGNKAIKFISKCPLCEEPLYVNKNRTFVSCKNPKCRGKITGKIQNYIEKMDIKGIKENTINTLVDEGVWKSIVSLYKTSEKKILTVKGFKEKSAQNIVKSINSKRKVYDWEVLGSLGIDLFSRSRAKDICKLYNIEELKSITLSELTNIEGVADKIAESIVKGMKKNSKLLDKLSECLEIVSYKDEINKNKSSISLKIVFTGYRDKDVQNKLELLGHKVTGSVSKNTNLVVAKDKNSSSSKIKTAKDLGIEVIEPDELKSRFNL